MCILHEGMRGVNVLYVFRALGDQVCDRPLACACVFDRVMACVCVSLGM
jgi:hypothetical protein